MLPKGLIEEGIAEACKVLREDLRHGIRHDDEYYFTVAAYRIWDGCIEIKELESDLDTLPCPSYRDLVYLCKKSDFKYEYEDKGYILYIRTPLHTYKYISVDRWFYGGPVESDLEFPPAASFRFCYETTLRAFYRLLCRFDENIDSIRPQLTQALRQAITDYRVNEILNASIKHIFEPGLEDIKYRYSCVSADGHQYLVVYLYGFLGVQYEFGAGMKITIPFDNLMKNMDLYKSMIRNINENEDNFESYRLWAEFSRPNYEDMPPMMDEKQF